MKKPLKTNVADKISSEAQAGWKALLKITDECPHNQRCRYTHGFHCEDCDTFFPIESATYRSGELLCSLWMVMNNINVDRHRNDLPDDPDVAAMKEEIGIGLKHDNYEDIIERAEKLIAEHGKNSESATVVLK